MTQRSWVTTWLSPLALSNTALAWATLIGGFSTLVLVPGPHGPGILSWQWLAIAAASQAAFALIVVVARLSIRGPGPVAVLLTLAVGGVVRGAIIAVGAAMVGGQTITAASVVTRAFNSAVISVVGVALIGATLAWRADFRAQYRLLRDRALLLGHAADDGEQIDPDVLDAWTSMKGGLDRAIRDASEHLSAGASRRDLDRAAALLSDAVDIGLRPAARAMWQEAIPDEAPLRVRSLLAETIGRWRLPLLAILGFLAVVVGIGSLVRSGLVDGGAYTLRYLIVTGALLWLSTSLARARPRVAPAIAVCTLVLLPPLVLLGDYWIGDVLLGLPEDPTGQIIVALQTPFTTVFIAMAVGAVRDRQQVLEALQARIDIEATLLRQGDGRDAQRLSLFVHHSVQSELSALALQIREAASTADIATMEDVRLGALERLGNLEALDAHSPPWLREGTGRERIARIVEAWTGLLAIDIDVPEESACRPHQWGIAARVIEEGLANSARHGGASHVKIRGEEEHGALSLRLIDDGTPAASATAERGIGTQWLDRVAPGDWSLEHSTRGTTLTVRIR